MKDKRWDGLRVGGGRLFDPRPLLIALAAAPESAEIWSELTDRLFQDGVGQAGGIGEASYAAVPHLVRIGLATGQPSRQLLFLVASIAIAQLDLNNPPLPDWLRSDFNLAIEALAQLSLKVLSRKQDSCPLSSYLSVIALSKGSYIYALILLEHTEKDLAKDFLGSAAREIPR